MLPQLVTSFDDLPSFLLQPLTQRRRQPAASGQHRADHSSAQLGQQVCQGRHLAGHVDLRQPWRQVLRVGDGHQQAHDPVLYGRLVA